MEEDCLHVHVLPVLVVEVGEEAGHRLEGDVARHLEQRGPVMSPRMLSFFSLLFRLKLVNKFLFCFRKVVLAGKLLKTVVTMVTLNINAR